MTTPRGLHRLARLHGVQTVYHDNDRHRIRASPEALMQALRALRVPVREADDIPRLLAERRRAIWERVVEPVVTALTGAFTLRLPVRHRGQPVEVEVGLEAGGSRGWSLEPASLEVMDRAEVGGAGFVAVRVPLPRLPPGYHDLHVGVGRRGELGRFRALLLVAPARAAGWDEAVGPRAWGLFAPLYSLWEQGDGGPDAARPPDLQLLEALAARVARHGGSVVGTLPILAAFLDDPYEPSPYAPVSRLFWNELYAAPPGGARPDTAAAFADGLFDPAAAMRAKRPAFEAGARALYAEGAEPGELAAFQARNPRAGDYARFRALVARLGPWVDWPHRLRARDVRLGDYDETEARYHLYVQWLVERQLAALKERAGSRGVGLYLDLPLGVHPHGYDVWRERELFATEASAGAPPDALAAGGQDWGFPPLHPEACREAGHGYFIDAIRTHLRFARVLRIDHVMQFTRMWWVVGGDARDGVYVRYPADELYAILCLESQRSGAVTVGEDLGTVPRQVRRDMRRHGLPGMYVGQFELQDVDADRALVPRRVRPGALAAIGTHDTPTFAGWWFGRDVEIRARLGQLDADAAARELSGRSDLRRKLAAGLGVGRAGDGEAAAEVAAEAAADAAAEAGAVHGALLRRLGRSAAGLVLATMEDLWLEREPQNVPGTLRPENWRRQSRQPLEALDRGPVAAQLDGLNASREGTA
jgi:4-alpha-glucanotransferase